MRRLPTTVALLALVAVCVGLTAPSPADAATYRWTTTGAERYMESYPNVIVASCFGRGSRVGRRYSRFGCNLVYTDASPGLAIVRPLSRSRAFVYWVS
jgi:hypothetical protein